MVEPDFEKEGGLIPAIVQDVATNEVLMLAWMNREAWINTVETGKATYWSRSRKKLWVKGESSGNVQQVKEIRMDCDVDAVILKVEQRGAACHEGYYSCFYRRFSHAGLEVVEERLFDPEEMYKK